MSFSSEQNTIQADTATAEKTLVPRTTPNTTNIIKLFIKRIIIKLFIIINFILIYTTSSS
jgi:hypothetical protein